jgi:nucleoid-associated protein YgaU
MDWIRSYAVKRGARRMAGAVALAWLAVNTGCNRQGGDLEVVAETDEKQYQYAQQMLKEDRQAEALAAFLRVIKKREDDAPLSQLAAGELCLNVKNDPIEAIYHFQRYLEAEPNSEQAPMVRELVDTAKKDFLQHLPGQPYNGEYDRLELISEIASLKKENDQLRSQLGNGAAGQTGGIHLGTLPASPSDNIAVAPVSANAPANPATANTPVKPAAAAKSYTVQSGDTLSNISSQVYGTKTRWKDILAANSDVLKSPKDLKPGQVLKIPQ